MKGIELSRRFYLEVVRPWLDAAAPGLPHSAALTGYGSELLGFDDETSRDHNWGPRVQLFVSPLVFSEHARRLIGSFLEGAPQEFLGEPIGYRARPNLPTEEDFRAADARHGVEILTLETHLRAMLGISSTRDITTLQWLGFAEQHLKAFTAGAVFHDDADLLSEARRALAYFPHDIWLFKIAGQWRRIAEEQAFVGRTGQVGDELGSRVVAARLVRDVMRLAFLLERQYAPYAKWFGSAFARLPLAAGLMPLLEQALTAGHWQDRGKALASAYLVLARRQLAEGIGGSFDPVIGPYHDRPFATINVDDIIAATIGAIESAEVRALPAIGSLDQVTDSTPVTVDPAGSHRMMRALLGPGDGRHDLGITQADEG